MKKIKFLAMMTIAAMFATTFTSCDKDDDDDNSHKWVKEYEEFGITYSISELKDDGSTISYSEKYQQGSDWCVCSYIYNYDKDGTITGMTETLEFNSSSNAKLAYDEFMEDEGDDDYYSSFVLNGKTITCIVSKKYLPETKDEVISEYNSYLDE